MTKRAKQTAVNYIKHIECKIPKEEIFRYKRAIITLLNDLENLNLWDKLPPEIYTFDNKYFDHENHPIILEGRIR